MVIIIKTGHLYHTSIRLKDVQGAGHNYYAVSGNHQNHIASK